LRAKVFVDANRDGTQNGKEVALGNVDVEIRNAAGVVVATAKTDANGDVVVTGLAPGEYTVVIVSGVPAEYAYLTNTSITVSVLGAQTTQPVAVFRLAQETSDLAFTGANQNPQVGFGVIAIAIGLVLLVGARRFGSRA
jgi:uncharacterized surface anchored protein